MSFLEAAIGLVLIFLALSFVATAIAEAFAEGRQWKGRLLHSKLKVVLGPGLVREFYCERRVADLASGVAPPIPGFIRRPVLRLHHWLKSGWRRIFGGRRSSRRISATTSLAEARNLAGLMNARRLPSRIPPDVFANVLMDWLQGTRAPLLAAKDGMPAEDISFELADLLQRMNVGVGGDQEQLRVALAAWYSQTTERLKGEFKRRVQGVLYVVGIVLVVMTNADAIRLSSDLLDNPATAAELTSRAQALAAECPGPLDDCPTETVKAALEPGAVPYHLLLGWDARADGASAVSWLSLTGWVLTVMAIGLGADFWYRALKRFLAFRGGIVPSTASAPGAAPTGAPRQAATVGQAPLLPIDISEAVYAPLKGFQPLRFSENDIHAFWLAQFASMAYGTPQELRSSPVVQAHQLNVDHVDRGTTQVFAFRNAATCIVAFRGTEMLPEDWLTDAYAVHKSSPWEGMEEEVAVHSGFHAALDLVWPDLLGRIADCKCPVWFTGHSLGGALAVLAAYRLRHCEKAVAPTIGGVYTFGQPRVGNVAFAERCSGELSERIFRYVNATDIVPLVPPDKPIEYAHIGNVRYFDASGYLHRRRTLWERVAEQLMPALRDVAAGHADWSDVTRNHLKQRMADHAMARYLWCVENMAAIVQWKAEAKAATQA